MAEVLGRMALESLPLYGTTRTGFPRGSPRVDFASISVTAGCARTSVPILRLKADPLSEPHSGISSLVGKLTESSRPCRRLLLIGS